MITKKKDRLPIRSDVMPNKIGHGITWQNNKIVYVEAKSALVVLRRQPNDPNDIDYRRVTTYLNIKEYKKYPDATKVHKKFNLVPYMMQTQAYKNAKTDAERQKLLSYVQRNDDSLSGVGLPASKASITEENKALKRDVPLSPELQSHYEEQQSFSDIQRNTGNTPTGPRHVECSLKENASDESQYY